MSRMGNKLSERQHGFVPGRSTITDLFVATQYIYDKLDKPAQVDVVYTDLSKAIDQLDHGILLNKLLHFGFSEDLVQLFRTYRQQISICSERGLSVSIFQGLLWRASGIHARPLTV